MLHRTAAFAAAALMALVAQEPAHAREPVEVTVTSGFLSKHAGSRQYNERNGGIGLRIDSGTFAGWTIGSYRNSLGRTTVYVAHEWQRQLVGPLHVGLVAGVATGYNVPVMPAVLPEAVLHIGDRVEVALLVQPVNLRESPAFAALQFRFKL